MNNWEKTKIAKLKVQSMPIFSGAKVEIEGDTDNYRLIICLPKDTKFPFKLPALIGGITVIYKTEEDN